jgi:hypothetical protein
LAVATAIALPDPPVLGGIDGVTGQLVPGGQVIVVGWAIDVLYGAPAARVEVTMNNHWTFSTVTGETRPDVEKTLQRADARLSGWTANIGLGTIPPGDYELGVLVFDVNGMPHQLPVRYPIRIVEDSVASTPAPAVEASPQPALSGKFESVDGTPRPGWVVIVAGWGVDLAAKKPATRVEILLDGKVALKLVPKVEREDVAKSIGVPDVLISGWTGRVPLPDDLTEGKHVLSAVLYDAAGASRELPEIIEINVLPKL